MTGLVFARTLYQLAVCGFGLAGRAAQASDQDADLCLATAERADSGEKLNGDEKTKAHEACLRALSDTASVVQKYQLHEADFAIMGTHHKY